MLKSPFSDDIEAKFEPESKSTEAESESHEGSSHVGFTFDRKVPRWARQIRVS